LEATLANTRSSKKRIRQNERDRQRNKAVRARAKNSVRDARQAVVSGQAGDAAVLEAIRELDKAAAKGVIHRNNAARRKSRLVKQLKHSTKSE
jgi:small subunit ribosomal protein S20